MGADVEQVDWRPIDPDQAHLNARAAFQHKFFWDSFNDYGPLGNDDGYPVFAGFRKWRVDHPNVSPLKFLHNLLQDWGVRFRDLRVVEASALRALVKEDADRDFHLHSHDQAIIALAFAQIYVEGTVDKDVKELAELAIQRQVLPELANIYIYPQERIRHLEIVRDVLSRF